ncbi:hypothetical protein DID88_002539 [Monilinia fructigena]|uniref:Uncharacterized protein n=1 Tax=Monilinia fructigena TaxID=38457 RepID=A0A395IP37_9HELO|nr:hypothetical protein DID88_002539 [Monilinia fructigena]
MSPPFGLDPDTPISSIERSDSGSPEAQVTAALHRRERIHPRGGLIGSQRHQTSNAQRIPPQLLREPRGSLASYADNLREFLGPLDPIGHEQRRQAIRLSRQQEQADIPDPTSDASYYESLREFLGPLNPRGQQQQHQQAVTRVHSRVSSQSHLADPRSQTAGLYDLQSSSQTSNSRPMSNHIRTLGSDQSQSLTRPRSMQCPSPYQIPAQITPFRRLSGAHRGLLRPIDSQSQLQIDAIPIHRSDSAQFHGQNVNRSDPVAYNPLSMALHHDNALQTPFRARAEPAAETGSNLSIVPAPNDIPMDKDRFSAPQALMDTATGSSSTTKGSSGTSIPAEKKRSRGRPLDSKTKNNDPKRMQIPNLRFILPVPSAGIPSQSSSIVPASIKLVADNGQEWEYKYPGTRRNWKKGPSGKVTVAKLNVWANAILRRRLPNDFPTVPRKSSISAHSKPKADKWTEWERGYLESHIMDAIRTKKGNLDEEDWKIVAEAQKRGVPRL